MKERELTNLKKTLTGVILVVLLAHLTVALSLTFFPKETITKGSKVGRLYDYLVHLGPFYGEESIKASPHFIIQSKNARIDVIENQTHLYQQQLWKLNALTIRDFTRRSADQFAKTSRKENSSAFRKLHQITSREQPGLNEGDSVSWIYLMKWYNPMEDQWKNDTVFTYQFKWIHDVAPR